MVQVRLIPAAAVVVLKVILFVFSGKGIFCLGFILLLAMRVCFFFPYDTMSGNRIESDPLCLSSELIRLIALLFYVISFDFFFFPGMYFLVIDVFTSCFLSFKTRVKP